MSTSAVRPSALGLALQSLPSPHSGGSDQSITGERFASTPAATSRAAGTDMSSTAQADALFSVPHNDADGKPSKAELRTGFQKLSQNVKSVLLDQQNSVDDARVTAQERSTETTTAPAADATADTSIDAIQLLKSLVQALQGSSATAISNALDKDSGGNVGNSSVAIDPTTSSQLAATSGSGATASISDDQWMHELKNVDRREIGDLANQGGIRGQQLSANLNESLTSLLQSLAS